jgi:excisionase family DNA binding protein
MQLGMHTKPLTRTDVLTAREVADFLRLPLSTVYDLARRGVLPGHRVGRAWRFVRQEIEQWLLAS